MANREQFIVGGFVMLAGLALMAVSVLDPRDAAFRSGRGVVTLAGAAFFFAGVAVLAAAVRQGRQPSRLQTAAGGLVLVFLLAVPLGLAWRADFGRGRTPVRFEPVAILLERKAFAPGEMVRIGFDRPLPVPEGYTYFISLVPPEAPIQHYGVWSYLRPGATQALLKSPGKEGVYELRLHPHLNEVLTRETIHVAGSDGDGPAAFVGK